MNKKTLIIMVGYTCNNNCIICSNRPDDKTANDRTTDDIVGDLIKGKKDGYNKVEFTGGEPTVRPDILKLAQYAKDIGYKEIAVSSNGRLFSYNSFCDKAVSSGINRVTFTLYGPTASVHDAITRTPGSFEQTISGIKNVLKVKDVTVTISTVVTALNFSHLLETKNLLSEIGVKRWSIAELIPYGNAKLFYKMLAVKFKDLSPILNELILTRDDLYYILFFDFSPCLFSSKARGDQRIEFITAKGRAGMTKQIGYKHIGERVSIGKESQGQDCFKEQVSGCSKCSFSKDCAGIWKDYIGLYGDREIKELALKNDCFQ
jgi:cyclic pyranopterin phosphate synthase